MQISDTKHTEVKELERLRNVSKSPQQYKSFKSIYDGGKVQESFNLRKQKT